MTSDLAEIGLAAFKKVTDLWKAGRADSLIEFTRPTRVEPIVLVDADLVHDANTPEVLQSFLSQFSGYYLQAVAVMANVGRVHVMDTLEKLSPNRDVLENGLSLIAEAYKDRLPISYGKQAVLEAEALQVSKDAISTAKERSDLSIGKLLQVEISDGPHKAVIPVNVRLIVTSLPSQTLVHILTVDTQDRSAADRYHGWKSGRLGFIRDLIFCQDLIDDHRRNLVADKDGVYSTLSKRASGNALSSIVSLNPSVATASNMALLSTRTAQELEVEMAGKLSNFHAREKLFAGTSCMIIAVLDSHYERVTFYHRSIAQATELGMQSLKASNKSGPDVGDILKAFAIGSAPAL